MRLPGIGREKPVDNFRKVYRKKIVAAVGISGLGTNGCLAKKRRQKEPPEKSSGAEKGSRAK